MVMLRFRDVDGSTGDIVSDVTGTLTQMFNFPDTLVATGASDVMAPFVVPGSGVILEDGDTGTSFEGFMCHPQENPRSTTITWKSWDYFFWKRISWPNPSSAWSAQTTNASYVVTGSSESVILDLINKNLGPGAYNTSPHFRRLPTLTIPSSLNRGSTRKVTTRFEVIGDLIRAIGNAEGLGVKIVDDGSGGLTVQITAAPDLTATARYGTASVGGPGVVSEDWSVETGAPDATAVLAAGQGVGTARATLSSVDIPAGAAWGYAEQFSDQRQTSDLTEVQKSADDDLSRLANLVTVSATIPDIEGLRLGTTNGVPLGALIGLDLGKNSLDERLRRVTTTFSPSGLTRSGLVGDENAGVTRTQQQIRELSAAFRRSQP